MATPLRYALIFLLWAMMAVIYAPLIPAALTLISPALSLTHWQALFADPQLPQALMATLVSTTIAAVGALLIALLVIVALWPGPKWQRMCARLPWLLAIPHVAFATSALLLFADGGLLYDYFPYFTPPMDKLGIGLGFTLAVKESAFLLWILAAVLSEKRLLQQLIVLDSLGYSRWQCLNWLLLPSVASALAMAMLAIVAWSLSVVDVAIILGPGNPPTLAVISWQWLTQGEADQQTKGALASLLLMLLLAAYVLLGYLLWRSWRRTIPRVDGVRKPATPLLPGITLASLLPLTGVLCVVLLAILADQSTINSEALINSLTMGLVATFIALLLLLLWLEWGPQRRQLWLWLPILLPALPLVAGQYTLALWLNLDGSWTAVVWGHLLWVMPWMLFILQPAWQRIDSRLILISADGEAWKIPVFQVIHRTEEDRFFAVGVEVRTVIPPDIQATVGGSVGWSHTLQEVSLLTVGFNPGAFQTQIHYISRPVTKGQCLQPGSAVVKVVDAAIVNFIARTVELVAGG